MTTIEQLMGLKKVSILQCQELAKDHGFDSMTFDLCGPKGKVKCYWLDAYMGMFQIEGQEGFAMTERFKYVDDIWCENLQPKDVSSTPSQEQQDSPREDSQS